MNPAIPRPGKIILFRTDRLGDLVLSFPVVESLRASYPEARVDFFVSPSTAPLARLQRHVSDVIEDRFSGPRGLADCVRLLRARGYDMAVHIYPRPRLALAAFLSRIPVRIGTAYRFYSPLFNQRVKVTRKRMTAHELDLNLRLIEAVAPPIRPVSFGIVVPERAQAEVDTLLAACGIGGPGSCFVVLHPSSGGSSLQWPPEHFGELGRALLARGIPVVLTGVEADRPVVDQVRSVAGEAAVDLCGRCDLEHLAALLVRASLLVSNSTGPLHLADALGTRVIGLYSPFRSSSPARWGPYSQRRNVFVPKGEICRHCTRDRCKDYNCMGGIRVEEVLREALRLITQDL
jgi:heptosyltransferase-3